MSYIKLPTFHAKRGGGIRVKRLLTYNEGIESGEESLYGTEYIYKMEDGSSSGIATFEPNSNRIENPKVAILPRLKQKLFNKLMSGRDKKFQEGPIGENLYPAASVGHQRVIAKNIHTGKSKTGFAVNTYFTCKDYPSVTYESTEIHEKPNQQTAHYRKTKINLPLGLFNYKKDNAWITQGYLFKINDLHGKMESVKTYGGEIDSELPLVSSIYNGLLSSTVNEYSHIDSLHKSIKMDGNRHFVLNDNYRPGEEEDITLYMGKVEESTNDFSLEMDLNIWLQVPPLFSIGFSPSISLQETQLSQHVTCRVLRRNSMLKKVTSYADGMESITEYLAYDDNTGNPILTKTNDQFEGHGNKFNDADRLYNDSADEEDHAYYSFNIPASWVYPEMGQMATDLSKWNMLNSNAGSVSTYMSNPLDKFDVTGKWDPYSNQIDKVIAASSVEYRKDRFVDAGLTDVTNTQSIDITGVKDEYKAVTGVDGFTNDHLVEMNRFFYPVASYTFLSEIVSANSNTIYEGGVIDGFSFFDWNEGAVPAISNALTGWKYATQITKYSPHGQALEELNILDIPSAVKFGYGKLLPSIVASNSDYETIAFEDFEFGNNFITDETTAHTGKRSINYTAILDGSTPILSNIKLTNRLYTNGGHFKVWLKSVVVAEENEAVSSIDVEGINYNLEKVARVGEWTLYQTYIKDWSTLTIGQDLSVKLSYSKLLGENLYIDDACFNPIEASINCTVYDLASFRVIAQFSDQHFAKIYEYDDEGKLVRTVIETEEGRKTLMEQQHNISRINR